MSQDIGRKKEFNETLSEIVEFATVSGNQLTKEQIRLYFQDIVDDEEKYEHIYRYLMELKINIDGVSPEIKASEKTDEQDEVSGKIISVGKEETEEAKAFYKMYMDELREISAGDGRSEDVIERYLEGDKTAAGDVTKYYLPAVVELSEEYLSGPLGKSDLVAEGNLALYEAVIEYEGENNRDTFRQCILDKVRKSMEKAVYLELGSGRTGSHLAERVNALNDASTEMAKELGREATLEELADRLALSTEEIKELMKISIDALTVDAAQE